MTTGNIECILAAVNNLSDSDFEILVNLIMDRLNPEKAFASSVKIVPRMECPVCHTSAHAVRNGHKHGKRAFLCRACKKSFVTISNTLLSGSHDCSEVWKTVLADTLMGVSLDDTRDGLDLQHIRISHTSLFFMRHKIMLALEDLQEVSPAMVEEAVEADETYVPEPEKGTKFGSDAKRKPRKRGTPASRRGLSDEQICICTAVQRKSGDLVVKSENQARPSTEDVVDIYTGHVKKGTLFLTDGRNVYPKLGKVLGLSVMGDRKLAHALWEPERAAMHLGSAQSLKICGKPFAVCQAAMGVGAKTKRSRTGSLPRTASARRAALFFGLIPEKAYDTDPRRTSEAKPDGSRRGDRIHDREGDALPAHAILRAGTSRDRFGKGGSVLSPCPGI